MIFLQDDDSKQQFMVDTGAVCSVLPHRWNAQPPGPQLSGADGRSIPTWGTIRRRLSFGLRTFFVTFFLAAVRRPILGLDFLSAHGLLVDPVGRQVLDSETALQAARRRRYAALKVRRRPLLHIAVSTLPASFFPSHSRRRKKQTVAETQNPPHHRDDRPPSVRRTSCAKRRRNSASWRRRASFAAPIRPGPHHCTWYERRTGHGGPAATTAG